MFYNVWENLKIKFYNLSHPQDDFVPAGTTPLSAAKSSSGFSFSLPELKLSSLRDAPFETKRIIVLIFVFLASILILSFLRASFYSYSASAVSKSDLRSGILFYDRDWKPSGSSSSCIDLDISLTGSNNQEKAWNFLLSAGISGISDNPSAIAGIIGNLIQESTSNLDPFIENELGCAGIYQACEPRKSTLMDDLTAHGITWGDRSQEDAALQIELAHMVNEIEYGESGFEDYKNNLGIVSAQNPRNFAELFLVTFERAVGGHESINDPGVRSLAGSYADRYEGAEARRANADGVYSLYSGNTAPESSGSNSTSSCYGAAQGNGDIAATAIALAWEEDYITADMERTPAATENPKPEYVSAMQAVGTYETPCNKSGCAPIGASCDQFTSTVLRYSGADSAFPIFGPSTQEAHMSSSSSYTRISEAENNNYGALQPGDIMVTPGHIHIYVEVNGQPKVAEAGFNRVTGEICYFYTSENYHVYRFTGGK